jgi:hypothetical protein
LCDPVTQIICKTPYFVVVIIGLSVTFLPYGRNKKCTLKECMMVVMSSDGVQQSGGWQLLGFMLCVSSVCILHVLVDVTDFDIQRALHNFVAAHVR